MKTKAPQYNILLIDDDKDFFVLIQDMFEDFRYASHKLEWMSSSSDLKQITNASYDVILLDYFIDQLTGLDILEKLQKNHVTTPVIFLTNNDQKRFDLEVISKGATDYISKEHLNPYILERSIYYAYERRKYTDMEKHSDLLSSIQELSCTIAHEFNQHLQLLYSSLFFLENEHKNNPHIQSIAKHSKEIANLVDTMNEITSLKKQEYSSNIYMIDLLESTKKKYQSRN